MNDFPSFLKEMFSEIVSNIKLSPCWDLRQSLTLSMEEKWIFENLQSRMMLRCFARWPMVGWPSKIIERDAGF